jgi:hypothetical protein
MPLVWVVLCTNLPWCFAVVLYSVYRACWRGRCVAVKLLHLPADGIRSGSNSAAAKHSSRERMAVMEAVVSITMSHPNIVQVGLPIAGWSASAGRECGGRICCIERVQPLAKTAGLHDRKG